MEAELDRGTLLRAMEEYFGDDTSRIEHARKVLEYAEDILEAQGHGCERDVVIAAAVMHDIGIKGAERMHGSSAAKYQEQEGPRVARNILNRLGCTQRIVVEVCDIIAHHHHPRPIESANFRVLWDADLLANTEPARMGSGAIPDDKSFYTARARELAGATVSVET